MSSEANFRSKSQAKIKTKYGVEFEHQDLIDRLLKLKDQGGRSFDQGYFKEKRNRRKSNKNDVDELDNTASSLSRANKSFSHLSQQRLSLPSKQQPGLTKSHSFRRQAVRKLPPIQTDGLPLIRERIVKLRKRRPPVFAKRPLDLKNRNAWKQQYQITLKMKSARSRRPELLTGRERPIDKQIKPNQIHMDSEVTRNSFSRLQEAKGLQKSPTETHLSHNRDISPLLGYNVQQSQPNGIRKIQLPTGWNKQLARTPLRERRQATPEELNAIYLSSRRQAKPEELNAIYRSRIRYLESYIAEFQPPIFKRAKSLKSFRLNSNKIKESQIEEIKPDYSVINTSRENSNLPLKNIHHKLKKRVYQNRIRRAVNRGKISPVRYMPN